MTEPKASETLVKAYSEAMGPRSSDEGRAGAVKGYIPLGDLVLIYLMKGLFALWLGWNVFYFLVLPAIE